MIDDETLIKKAKSVVNPRRLSQTVEVGSVGSALVTSNGNVFVGVCIDAPCGIGFCAEHTAIASIVTAGESRIITIVAVNSDHKIVSPCGRCRELIWQVDAANVDHLSPVVRSRCTSGDMQSMQTYPSRLLE
jgi:cytidine deaminase